MTNGFQNRVASAQSYLRMLDNFKEDYEWYVDTVRIVSDDIVRSGDFPAKDLDEYLGQLESWVSAEREKRDSMWRMDGLVYDAERPEKPI